MGIEGYDALVKLGSQWGIMIPALAQWIEKINQGVQNGYGQYPFLAYGTDWLAFGHIAIAMPLLALCVTRSGTSGWWNLG